MAKYVCFLDGSKRCLGRLDDEMVVPVSPPAGLPGEDPMISLIRSGAVPTDTGAARALSEIQLCAPIHQPSKNVICVGLNYHAHADEFSSSGYDSATKAEQSTPSHPIVFTKAPNSLTGAFNDVKVPWGHTNEVDYEAELAVVIGQGGRHIAKEDAYNHVFGYSVINDVTARDLQRDHKQWFLGKSIDSFCPMGPSIVTADEVEPENLELRCWVNGELRQSSNTRDLIFDIPTLIATISASMELCPGDIIATGTPKGVGIGYTPPRFLHPGDTVRVEISSIGIIENTIR